MKKYTILIFCMLFICPIQATACSNEAARERQVGAFEKAQSVFHAKITETKLVENPYPEDKRLEGIVRVKYQVIEAFKGNPPEYLLAPIFDMCGFGFIAPGFKYIIYTERNDTLKDNIVSSSTDMMREVFGESDSKDQEMLELVRKQAKHYKRGYNK